MLKLTNSLNIKISFSQFGAKIKDCHLVLVGACISLGNGVLLLGSHKVEGRRWETLWPHYLGNLLHLFTLLCWGWSFNIIRGSFWPQFWPFLTCANLMCYHAWHMCLTGCHAHNLSGQTTTRQTPRDLLQTEVKINFTQRPKLGRITVCPAKWWSITGLDLGIRIAQMERCQIKATPLAQVMDKASFHMSGLSSRP